MSTNVKTQIHQGHSRLHREVVISTNNTATVVQVEMNPSLRGCGAVTSTDSNITHVYHRSTAIVSSHALALADQMIKATAKSLKFRGIRSGVALALLVIGLWLVTQGNESFYIGAAMVAVAMLNTFEMLFGTHPNEKLTDKLVELFTSGDNPNDTISFEKLGEGLAKLKHSTPTFSYYTKPLVNINDELIQVPELSRPFTAYLTPKERDALFELQHTDPPATVAFAQILTDKYTEFDKKALKITQANKLIEKRMEKNKLEAAAKIAAAKIQELDRA